MNERDLQDTSLSEPGTLLPAVEVAPPLAGPKTGSTRPGSESDLLRLKEAAFEVYGWVPMEADE